MASSKEELSTENNKNLNMRKCSEYNINDFVIKTCLGSGSFANVFKAENKKTKSIVALKMIKKSLNLKKEMDKQFIEEKQNQSGLKHPNILKMLTAFTNDRNYVFVLEFAPGGELYKLLKDQPNCRFGEQKTSKYIYQVADALLYCHQQNIIHRDIKPENLLLSKKGDIKLADFGQSVHTLTLRCNKRCGTLDYMSPEILSCQEYNEKVDNWAVGVLCYELLVGKPPFRGKTEKETIKNIINGKLSYPLFVTFGAKDLIENLLQRDSELRLKLNEVLSHFWIQQNKDLKEAK